MGKQYYGSYKSYNDVDWVVELHSSATATNYELTIGADPNIHYEGEGQPQFPGRVMSSEATIKFVMRDEADYTNFYDLGFEPEQEWIMKIYREGVLYWVGMVLTDQITYLREAPETGYAIIEVKAKDGLNRLSGFDVLPGWFTSNRATFASVAVQIINMLGLSDEWASNTDYVRWAGQHTNANTHASYGTFDAKIRDLAFVKNKDVFKDVGEIEWTDCKQALEYILTAFGARIHHGNGVYWITQVNAYDDSAWTYTAYDNGGAVVGSYNQSYTHRQTVDDGARPCWEALPEKRHEPPVRAAIAEFDRVNGVISSKTTQNTTAITCTHDNITTTASPPAKAIKIDIDIDFSYYAAPVNKYEVHKTYYADNGAGGTKYQPILGVWTAIGGSPVADVQTYYDTTGGDLTRNFKHSVELVAPPSGQTNVVCTVEVKKIKGVLVGRPSGGTFPVSWTTASTSAFEFTGSVTIMQAFNSTMPWEYVQEYKQTSDLDTPRDDNSEKIEIFCPFYNGKKYDVGSILVKTGAATWGEAGDWSAPWTTLDADLPAMLANQIAGLHSDYMPTIRGTIQDDGLCHAVSSLYFDNTIWCFNGGTFNMSLDTWEGEWIGVLVVYTNVNNNGEGERTQKQDDIIIDTQKELQVDLDAVRKMVGNMPLVIMPTEIINNALGAPSADPGVDKEYVIGLYYDYDASNPTLKWKVREYAAPGAAPPPAVHTIAVGDSPYTITETDGIVLIRCNCAGGAITVNLPTAVSHTGMYTVKKIDSSVNAVTIEGDSVETIDGAANHTLTLQWESVTMLSNEVDEYNII